MFICSKPDQTGVRVALVGIVKDGELHVGVARCSEKDTFTRKLAKTIATGRAEKCPIYTTLTNSPTRTFYSLSRFIISHAKHTKQVK